MTMERDSFINDLENYLMEEEAKELAKKISRGKYDLEDFFENSKFRIFFK